jgi:D-threo-aldose 1-dehydrogenase
MTVTVPQDPVAKRVLGTTGLQVTPLCVGCAPLGDMPETFAYSVAEEQALATLRAAFAGPINFLDTAYSYGDGESERRIGVALRELRGVPQGYVIGTKCDRHLQTGDFSGDQIRRSIERSLRLLGLERLDLLHLHDPEHTTFENVMSRGGPLDVMRRFKDEGVVAHLGVAGGPIDQMIRYVETGAFEVLVTHNRYTLLNRSAASLFEVAARRGVAVLNAAPYGSGILAKGPDAYARYAYQDAPPEMVERVRRMDAICRRHGVPLAAAALQFSMGDPHVVSTIVGMTRPERIEQTLTLARHPIPDALWPELDAVGYTTQDPESERWRR